MHFTGAISGNNVLVYNRGASAGSTDSFRGELFKVKFIRGDAAAAGSVFLYESGVALELLWQKIGGLQTSSNHYPRVYPVDETNVAISGAGGIVVPRVVTAPLVIVGSGFGNAASGVSGLQIWFKR